MLTVVAEIVLAPLLVAGSTIACRGWGARVGGVLSAFPAVVGPVLMILAQQRGAVFTAQAANATLLGLVGLSGFAVTYCRMAKNAGWAISLAAGWGSAALVAALVAVWGGSLSFPAGAVAAMVAIAAARSAIPVEGRISPESEFMGTDIPLRMAATAVLVLALAAAADLLGPLIGGMLAGLPALASVLAVFTHRAQGPQAVVALLRGMLTGMAGFVGFCAVVAVLVVPAGIAVAFAAAAVAAVILHATTVRLQAVSAG